VGVTGLLAGHACASIGSDVMCGRMCDVAGTSRTTRASCRTSPRSVSLFRDTCSASQEKGSKRVRAVSADAGGCNEQMKQSLGSLNLEKQLAENSLQSANNRLLGIETRW
jgi:hypothetical protein